MSKGKRWWAAAGGGVVGLLAGLGLFLWPGPLATVAGAAEPLPRLFQAPAYQLKDQLGKPVSSMALLGKVRIVVTLDPYCPTLCPLTLSKVQNLEARLDARHLAGAVQFVAFDIDKAAGPGDLRAFLKPEGVDPGAHWLAYLWGPPGVVRDVVRNGYHTSYYSVPNKKAAAAEASALQARMANPVRAKAGVSSTILHQSPLFVVDRQGWVRAAYGNAGAASLRTIVDDVARLTGGHG